MLTRLNVYEQSCSGRARADATAQVWKVAAAAAAGAVVDKTTHLPPRLRGGAEAVSFIRLFLLLPFTMADTTIIR